MDTMRVYMNFREIKGPYGGANSFLRALRRSFERRNLKVVNDVNGPFDIALLNALTDGIDLEFVQQLAKRNIPIVHRKVGYRVSGSPDMRRRVNGVVWGDKLQIDFTPHIQHSIFQSTYSRNVFLDSGFHGEYSVIHNGVDEDMFNLYTSGILNIGKKPRTFWTPGRPMKIIISSWSRDYNKGFEEYAEIDRQLKGVKDIQVSLVGRLPDDLRFGNIRVHRPRAHARLAALLKRHHVLLQLARFETCSNALIEGINCGLPVIYLDSGANKEIAEDYGVQYRGDFFAAIEEIRAQYGLLIKQIQDNPYRISLVADRYLSVLRQVLGDRRKPSLPGL